ncbi:MAG: hypothetical protein IT438_02965 [Phycisphaerales bacterium]|nr:hypothetical protein [Phycisphaerales bacterium]
MPVESDRDRLPPSGMGASTGSVGKDEPTQPGGLALDLIVRQRAASEQAVTRWYSVPTFMPRGFSLDVLA